VHAEQSQGGVTAKVGAIRIPKGAPVTIGGYWVLSGPDTALGTGSMRGAKIAFRSRQ
jgi:branched-chain amino acid transport system substrate-binding protein